MFIVGYSQRWFLFSLKSHFMLTVNSISQVTVIRDLLGENRLFKTVRCLPSYEIQGNCVCVCVYMWMGVGWEDVHAEKHDHCYEHCCACSYMYYLPIHRT